MIAATCPPADMVPTANTADGRSSFSVESLRAHDLADSSHPLVRVGPGDLASPQGSTFNLTCPQTCPVFTSAMLHVCSAEQLSVKRTVTGSSVWCSVTN